MKLRKNLLQILRGISEARYYRSISTLPIGNWFELHRTGDRKQITHNGLLIGLIYLIIILLSATINVWLSLSLVVLGYIYHRFEIAIASVCYDEIYNEFIARIGLNKEYIDWLNMSKRIALLKCECAIEPSSINLAHLDIELKKLEKKQTEKQLEYTQIIAKISKSQGYRIDPKKVSVLEFYSYING